MIRRPPRSTLFPYTTALPIFPPETELSRQMTTSTTSIDIMGLQAAYANRCGRSRHLARKLSLRRKRSSPNVFEMAATETITSIILIKLRSEERFSRNAETDLVCRLLLEKRNDVQRTWK